jgi:hypothetical protein
VVAKSSGESELYGIIRASSEGLGIVTLLKDFGVEGATVSIGIDATAAMGMAQRVGLNKVRHVEVDVLWIQEQQARKLLPLKKIPGPRNPSDLCTKNVPASLVEQYMQQISVKIVDGRAAVAQQLHVLNDSLLVNAPGEVGVLLTPVIGGQPVSSVHASLSDGALLGRVIGGRLVEDRAKRNRKRSADERCVDSWLESGENGRWVRRHRTPRRSLFTPHKVAGGPPSDAKIETSRITKGTFISSGKSFVIKDDYSKEVDAHKLLEGAWTGFTEFRGADNAKSVHIEGEKIQKSDEVNGQETLKNEPQKVEMSSSSSGPRVYAATSGCRFGPSDRCAWADMDSDTEDAAPVERGGERQTLSYLSAGGAASARVVPRPCIKSASPCYLGKETGRTNGVSKWSAGVSRSEASDADSAAAARPQVSHQYVSSHVESALNVNRPRPVIELSSEAQVACEGECQVWHGQIDGHIRDARRQSYGSILMTEHADQTNRARSLSRGLKSLGRNSSVSGVPRIAPSSSLRAGCWAIL